MKQAGVAGAIEPSRVPGDHDLFICGNDAAAKRQVTDRLCEWFGWRPGNIIDLGDITNSRGTEMFLALWVRLWGVVGHPHFNIRVVRGSRTGGGKKSARVVDFGRRQTTIW
jgi:8-hydroxy-5-deazaflavin:NADPH oxidoreductase